MPTFNVPEHLLRINYAEARPGTKTLVHTHPGSETFYVFTGELGQKTPHAEMHVEAGQSMAGVRMKAAQFCSRPISVTA